MELIFIFCIITVLGSPSLGSNITTEEKVLENHVNDVKNLECLKQDSEIPSNSLECSNIESRNKVSTSMETPSATKIKTVNTSDISGVAAISSYQDSVAAGTNSTSKPELGPIWRRGRRRHRRPLRRPFFQFTSLVDRFRSRPNPPGYNRRRNRLGNMGRFRKVDRENRIKKRKNRMNRRRRPKLNRRQQFTIRAIPALFL